MPKVCLLAGGMGTRLMEETTVRPKPMVEIGGRPLLWHIMNIYAAHGFDDFIVALGYKGEQIRDFFAAGHPWKVDCVDTGAPTGTGGRLKRLAPRLKDGAFFMTYGDGVCDADIKKVYEFHRSRKRLATVLAVRPPARFGSLSLDGDKVTRFAEKPEKAEGWINGGFFVLEPEVLDFIDGDDVMFEHAPLARLADAGQLSAYRHEGFWHCMDTLRDVRSLEGLWKSERPPWKTW